MGRWCCQLRPSNNTGKVKSATPPSKSLLGLTKIASQIYETQKKLEFPGLVKECRGLIRKLELPNIIDLSSNGKIM